MFAAVMIVVCSVLIWWMTEGLVAWIAGGAALFFGAAALNGLISSPDSGTRASANAATVHHLPGNGSYDFEVVGESNYQAALDQIAGPKSEQGAHHLCTALIRHEPDNRHDSNACAVWINNMLVGYLPRRAAARMVKARLGKGDQPGFCCSANALITGGWHREGSEGSYGVSLDFEGVGK